MTTDVPATLIPEDPGFFTDAEEPASRRSSALRRFLSNRVAVAAAIVLVVLALVAIFAPWITPHDPNQQDLVNRFKPPRSPGHPLGTDDFGRDVLSRLMAGARVSLAAALEVTVIAIIIGVPAGLLAGFHGGWVDATSSRVSDAVMSVPFLILALTVISIVGHGLGKAMAVVGIVLGPSFFRVARGVSQNVSRETFIEASRAIGCRTSTTLGRHVLPNVLAPLLVQTAVTMGVGVSAEAALSFLGLGVTPPQASWGSMLRTALANVTLAPYLAWAPGIVITITVLALTLVGDGLRDAVGTRRIVKRKRRRAMVHQ